MEIVENAIDLNKKIEVERVHDKKKIVELKKDPNQTHEPKTHWDKVKFPEKIKFKTIHNQF